MVAAIPPWNVPQFTVLSKLIPALLTGYTIVINPAPGESGAIVLDDADLTTVVEGLEFVGVINSGQACGAQTRVLVSRDRHDEVAQVLAAAAGRWWRGSRSTRPRRSGGWSPVASRSG